MGCCPDEGCLLRHLVLERQVQLEHQGSEQLKQRLLAR
jgi:hypothetical protein